MSETSWTVVQQTVKPSGWRTVQLGEAIEVNPRRALTKGTEAPFVAMADMLEHHRLLPPLETREYRGGGSRFRNGDTLLARITPCLENGKTAQVSGLSEGETGHGSTEFIVLSAREDVSDSQFIYYVARLPHFRSYAIGQMTGTSGRQRVPIDAVKSFVMPLPPLAEQRAIASVLGALDNKIEQNRQTAGKLEQLARAIFLAWFVEFEPVKAKAAGAVSFLSMPPYVFDSLPSRFVDSEIGPVPEGWEVKAIEKVAMFLNGLALQKYPPRGDGNDLPVIKIGQLRKGSTEGADYASGNISGEYIVNDRELLFSWSGTLEAILWFGGKGALNQHLFKVTSSRYPSWFCLLWIRHHLPWFRVIAASKATTMGHIKRSHLREAKVVVPTPDILHEADARIGSLYKLYEQLMIENRNLEKLRDFLLPNLLSERVKIIDLYSEHTA